MWYIGEGTFRRCFASVFQTIDVWSRIWSQKVEHYQGLVLEELVPPSVLSFTLDRHCFPGTAGRQQVLFCVSPAACH